MGLFDTATGYQHKAELRESKDEILVGELIRGLSALGWNPYRLIADSDRQAVGFKVPADPVISAYSLTIFNIQGSTVRNIICNQQTVIFSINDTNLTSTSDNDWCFHTFITFNDNSTQTIKLDKSVDWNYPGAKTNKGTNYEK